MQLIPILVVEDREAALGFYAEAFGAATVAMFDGITQMQVQDQVFGVREADDQDGVGCSDSVLLLIQTAAPDVVQAEVVKHGARVITPVDDRESGLRAGRFRDPFGFQWIVSTKPFR